MSATLGVRDETGRAARARALDLIAAAQGSPDVYVRLLEETVATIATTRHVRDALHASTLVGLQLVAMIGAAADAIEDAEDCMPFGDIARLIERSLDAPQG